jgi:hypothetical protein
MPFTARTFPSIKSGLDTFPQIFQQVCSFDRSSHKTDGKKDATCYQIRPQIIDRTADDTFPKGQLLEEKARDDEEQRHVEGIDERSRQMAFPMAMADDHQDHGESLGRIYVFYPLTNA